LRSCLNGLSFCQQLMVVDLGSTDESVAVARQFGATVLRHPHVPIAEQARAVAVRQAAHDWIVLADPDEVVPAGLVSDIITSIMAHPRLGILQLPRVNYFRGRPVTCTIWGRENTGGVVRVVHRERVEFRPLVHRGLRLCSGYEQMWIAATTSNTIRHYWADSYKQLLEKHLRYIEHEGKSLYETGERFGWRCTVRATRDALKQNLFEFEGIKGGRTGVFLSLFYTWYVFMSRLSLRRYQRSIARE